MSTTSNLRDLDFDDTDPDLFASPSKLDPTTETSNGFTASRNHESKYDAEEAREAALRRELEGVRSINEVIEGVLGSLEKAKDNMETVSRTVTSASSLLNTWSRILSQTEHNQRLILSPNWHGASQDVADIENEAVLKQQAAERRELEEQERQREAALRKAQEEERRKLEATTGKTRGTRGRGRGLARGASSVGSKYTGVGGQGGARGTTRGASSGYGRVSTRGGGAVRARGRGA